MADPTWLDNWRQANGWPPIPEDPEELLGMFNDSTLQMSQELNTFLIMRLMTQVTP